MLEKRKKQISAEDLDVMLFINKMARKCLEQNESDIVDSIKEGAEKDSMALPFLWRCFSPTSWDFMIHIEQLACSLLKPKYGFHTKVTLLKSDGSELPCWASIRYNLSEDKIFESVEFYLIPIDSNDQKEKKAQASYDNEAELLSAFELGKILKIQ